MALTFSKLNERILLTAIRKSLPVVAGFELTARCNLRCQMCFVCANNEETRSRELTAAQWIDLARQAQKSGVLYLLLSGGEPILRSDFWEIYEAIYKMGFRITLNTNGTTITPEVYERLCRFPPVRVTVSIYGSSPEAYQKVTGVAAGYEKMRRGVDLLLKGPWDLKLRTTMTRHTMEDLPAIARLIQDYGKVVGLTDYIAPCRDITGMDPLGSRLGAEETVAARRLLEQALEEYYKEKVKAAAQQAQQAPDEAEPPSPQADKEQESPAGEQEEDPDDLTEMDVSKLVSPDHAFSCGAGHYSFWITWQGEMTPCTLMAEPAVPVKEKSLAEAWNQLVEECAHVPICQECAACELKKYCLSCPARLRAETGALGVKAGYLCETALAHKSYFDDLKKRRASEEEGGDEGSD